MLKKLAVLFITGISLALAACSSARLARVENGVRTLEGRAGRIEAGLVEVAREVGNAKDEVSRLKETVEETADTQEKVLQLLEQQSTHIGTVLQRQENVAEDLGKITNALKDERTKRTSAARGIATLQHQHCGQAEVVRHAARETKGVSFAAGSAKLESSARKLLDTLKAAPEIRAIVGTATPREKNAERLARERAGAVRNYLGTAASGATVEALVNDCASAAIVVSGTAAPIIVPAPTPEPPPRDPPQPPKPAPAQSAVSVIPPLLQQLHRHEVLPAPIS
ncbi:MAG: hypothetical protein Q8R13_04915 [bacterium]|nr:hypothetical protein [bacterium]MDZ4296497.1 hypothetical protein [Patescibacteria group bacterium]